MLRERTRERRENDFIDVELSFAIHKLCGENGEIRSVDIADEMHVARASVCKALDRLTDNGLAYRDDSYKVRLTSKGEEVIGLYFTAHAFLSDVLTDKLSLSKENAEKEAVAVLGAMSPSTVKNWTCWLTVSRRRDYADGACSRVQKTFNHKDFRR